MMSTSSLSIEAPSDVLHTCTANNGRRMTGDLWSSTLNRNNKQLLATLHRHKSGGNLRANNCENEWRQCYNILWRGALWVFGLVGWQGHYDVYWQGQGRRSNGKDVNNNINAHAYTQLERERWAGKRAGKERRIDLPLCYTWSGKPWRRT